MLKTNWEENMATNIKTATKTSSKATNKAGEYYLPPLPYGLKDLEPYISEQQLTLHYQKHHQSYVNAANVILAKMSKARKENSDLDVKALAKELSFNVGGINLHNLFWQNMAPAGKGGGGEPADVLGDAIKDEFGGFARFKKEFTLAATTCEGSGWAALTYCTLSNRLMIAQIEKHNTNFSPGCQSVILVLDVWEHAYYLDYKNERPRFVDAFWNIVNWNVVKQRFENL
jgi:superoxide dismutase, Fe-Mn family